MSANNLLTINKSTFVVKDVCADTGHGFPIGRGKSLEEAIDIADKYQNAGNLVEYGICFIGKWKRGEVK